MKNRSRMEIFYDIVSASKQQARKTHLMFKSNLSHKQLDIYLSTLLESGLVEERMDVELGRVYIVTKRGLDFLSRFESVASFFNGSPGTKGMSQDSDMPFEAEAGVKVIEAKVLQH